MKNRIGVNIGKDISESTQAGDHNLRTLMDFQNIETYFPKLKFPEHESLQHEVFIYLQPSGLLVS